MSPAKVVPLVYSFLILLFSCSKDNESNDPTTYVGGSTSNSITPYIEFLFSPDGSNIAGKGSIYYDNNGSKTYVFGTESNQASWTGANTLQSTSKNFSNIPHGVLVHFSFASDPGPMYSSPLLTVKNHSSNGSINILVAASHVLTGSFQSPQ